MCVWGGGGQLEQCCHDLVFLLICFLHAVRMTSVFQAICTERFGAESVVGVKHDGLGNM